MEPGFISGSIGSGKEEKTGMVEKIQSEQNRWLKRVKALGSKKYRQEYKEFVAEGLRFVQEALEKDAVEVLLVDEKEEKLLERLEIPVSVPVFLVKQGLLQKVLSTVHPQGIAAVARQKQWNFEMLASMTKIIILDGVQDPGNVGTILRTALASGTEAVLCLKGTVDLYNDKTLRSTMGAIFRIPVFHIDDVDQMREQLHKWGFQILVADIRAERNYDQMTFPEKSALVVSNEANGPQLIKEGDVMVKIPLYQEMESLNVAVAAGILLYAIPSGNRK